MDDKTAEKIQKTFEELGIKGFRPWRDLLIIRTNPMPKKTGSIYLPEKLTTFYGELPHLQPITGMVIAAGPKATVPVGDHVAFMRLHFARWQTLEDGTVVGWIQEAHVEGHVDLDPDETFADLRVENATPRRLHG